MAWLLMTILVVSIVNVHCQTHKDGLDGCPPGFERNTITNFCHAVNRLPAGTDPSGEDVDHCPRPEWVYSQILRACVRAKTTGSDGVDGCPDGWHYNPEMGECYPENKQALPEPYPLRRINSVKKKNKRKEIDRAFDAAVNAGETSALIALSRLNRRWYPHSAQCQVYCGCRQHCQISCYRCAICYCTWWWRRAVCRCC